MAVTAGLAVLAAALGFAWRGRGPAPARFPLDWREPPWFELAPGGDKPLRRLEGVVKDASGAPVAGARLIVQRPSNLHEEGPALCAEGKAQGRRFEETCHRARAVADAFFELQPSDYTLAETVSGGDGRYSFMLPEGRYDLLAVSGSKGAGVLLDAGRTAGPADVTLAVLRGRGTVTDAAGPAGRAFVSIMLLRPLAVWHTESAPDGTFELGPLPAGPGAIRVRKPGYLSTARPFRAGTTQPQRIGLDRQFRLSGRVLHRGEPVPQAEVSLDPRDGRTLVADRRGRFRVDDAFVPAGTVAARARTGDERAPTLLAGAALAISREGEAVFVEIETSDEPPLRVVVRDAKTGAPVPDAWVEATPEVEGVPPVGFGEPRSDGTRSPALLAPGRYVLRAGARGYLEAGREVVVEATPTEVNLALDPGEELHGVVSDPSGRPLPAFVCAEGMRPEGGGDCCADTDSQGAFALRGLRGAVRVRVASRWSGGDKTLPVLVRTLRLPHDEPLLFVREPGGFVEVLVQAPTGERWDRRPTLRMHVETTRADVERERDCLWHDGSEKLRVGPLPEGVRAWFEVTWRDGLRAASEPVEIRKGRVVQTALRLVADGTPGHLTTGVAVTRSGRPAAGIHLEFAAGSGHGVALAGDDGAFATVLHAGDYRSAARRWDGSRVPLDRSLRAGQRDARVVVPDSVLLPRR